MMRNRCIQAKCPRNKWLVGRGEVWNLELKPMSEGEAPESELWVPTRAAFFRFWARQLSNFGTCYYGQSLPQVVDRVFDSRPIVKCTSLTLTLPFSSSFPLLSVIFTQFSLYYLSSFSSPPLSSVCIFFDFLTGHQLSVSLLVK
ncbi:hypothetical protein GGS20DRAFT_381939 [Poronia punctata]|nr:hypothetical protein GGS20DRAFT_381939 [Poronia punctata]